MDRCRRCGLEIGKLNGRLVHLFNGVYWDSDHTPLSSRIEDLPQREKISGR